MEFFKSVTQIDFMGVRRWSMAISLAIVAAAMVGLFKLGLRLGLDFTGGTEVTLRFSPEKPVVPLSSLEASLSQGGRLPPFKIKSIGQPYFLLSLGNAKPHVTTEQEASATVETLQTFLKSQYGDDCEIVQVNRIGAEVGQELTEQGAFAVFLAILTTMMYVAIRFEWRLAVGAGLALLHDAAVILGIFAWCGLEFNLAVLAAILAIMGYSLNDTIVVFDRLRENVRKTRTSDLSQIMNASINQTLSRTLMTSLLTFLVALALLLGAGQSLMGFALVLCIGIVVGTYSSIYIAGGIAIALGLSRNDLVKGRP